MKRIINILFIFFITLPSANAKEIVLLRTKECGKYTLSDYQIKNNILVVVLSEYKIHKRVDTSSKSQKAIHSFPHFDIYYKYEDNKLIKISEQEFKKLDTKSIFESNESDGVISKSEGKYYELFKQNNKHKKIPFSVLKFKDGEYIVTFSDYYYWLQDLYIFTGKIFKIIDLGDINPITGLGNKFIYYDKEYDKLYFSGWKGRSKERVRNISKTDPGLYVYDLKKKTVKLLHKIDTNALCWPYRIPGTDKLIYVDYDGSTTRCIKVYLRDIEK